MLNLDKLTIQKNLRKTFLSKISSQGTPCIPDKQSAVRLLKNIWTLSKLKLPKAWNCQDYFDKLTIAQNYFDKLKIKLPWARSFYQKYNRKWTHACLTKQSEWSTIFAQAQNSNGLEHYFFNHKTDKAHRACQTNQSAIKLQENFDKLREFFSMK